MLLYNNQLTEEIYDASDNSEEKNDAKESKKEFSTVQCNGVTKKGAQCKRMVSSSDGYCYQHKK